MKPEFRRTTDDGFAKFQRFIREHLDCPKVVTEAEVGAFCHVVSALCGAVVRNFQVLGQAYDAGDQTMMAWSCRNLLELAIFTKFVLTSKANADEFAADRLVDVHEIASAFIRMQTELDPNASDPQMDEVLKTTEAQMKAEGVKLRKPLSIANLARLVNEYPEYSNMNKLCSKFVHPTAWNLLTSDEQSTRFPYASDLFFLFGTKYLFTLFAEVRPHVMEYGLHHRA